MYAIEFKAIMGVKFWVNKGVREITDTMCYSNQNVIHICIKYQRKRLNKCIKRFETWK